MSRAKGAQIELYTVVDTGDHPWRRNVAVPAVYRYATITEIGIEQILNSRYAADADTRMDIMPNFGSDAILKSDQITDVANFVWTLSGNKPDDVTDGLISLNNCRGKLATSNATLTVIDNCNIVDDTFGTHLASSNRDGVTGPNCSAAQQTGSVVGSVLDDQRFGKAGPGPFLERRQREGRDR